MSLIPPHLFARTCPTLEVGIAHTNQAAGPVLPKLCQKAAGRVNLDFIFGRPEYIPYVSLV